MTAIHTGESPSLSNAPALLDDHVFAQHLAGLNGCPPWLRDRKESLWSAYQAHPYPRRRDERWRFASIDAIRLDSFRPPGVVPVDEYRSLGQVSPMVDDCAGELVFVNDALVRHQDIDSELKRKGVVWMSLSAALSRHEDLVRDHLLQHTPDLGSEKFQALHGALGWAGGLLYVPPGVEIDRPFVIRHWAATGNAAVFPHTLVIAEENARFSLVEIFQSTKSHEHHFCCGMAEVSAGAGAQVFYKAVQDWSPESLSFHLNAVTAERDSGVKTVMLNLGSRYCRSEQHTRLVGPGCSVENYALGIPTGSQELDQRTLQSHLAPNSHSTLLYKNVLLDDARTIFSGLIRVDEVAQLTDAYQTNRNLLLSNTAEANSLPGLEILADDVKCSHGATIGRLDEDQLFYLMSRGISERKAQQLLVFGFFEEIIKKLESRPLRQNLRQRIRQKFHA